MAEPIYVEITIARQPADVWERTQDPALHERWDARFSRIDYPPGDGDAQRFRYERSLLPGLVVRGWGYRGWFAVEERPAPAGGVPDDVRPRREERRE